jgi:hypothetical protein
MMSTQVLRWNGLAATTSSTFKASQPFTPHSSWTCFLFSRDEGDLDTGINPFLTLIVFPSTIAAGGRKRIVTWWLRVCVA